MHWNKKVGGGCEWGRGLQRCLHNEGWLSLSTTDGGKVYDGLLQYLDPKLVKFQFQVSEIAHGFDAVESI